MLGRDRNNDMLFPIHPTVGYQQHCGWKGRPGPAEPTSLGWEEMGLERCGMEVRVSRRRAVLYLGLDVSSQARVRGLLNYRFPFPGFCKITVPSDGIVCLSVSNSLSLIMLERML